MKKAHRKISRRDILARGLLCGGAALVAPSTKLLGQATGHARPLNELLAKVSGEVIIPADNGYDAARQLWNGMIDKRPAAIVRCAGPADVIDVVNFARSNDWSVSVRGGGHNVAGRSLRDDGLAIDLYAMRGIRVDPRARRVRAQGGATWAELDRETLAHDLVTTGGTVSSTGIGGLTLGGGVGWLMRKHGLACDNLTSVDVVTADGRLLTASEEENADLFWAVRGGGGNFGVVTSFEYALHELEPITGGIALYPSDMLEDLLRFYREFTNNAPDSVTTVVGALYGPEGTSVAGELAGFIAVAHSGPLDEGERLLRPIKEFGPPAFDAVGPMSYAALQTMFDASSQPGDRNYWRSNFLTELGDDAIGAIMARIEGLPRPGSALMFEHLQGAVGRVGEGETAFANRAAKYNCAVLSAWTDEDDDEQNVAWTRAFGDTMRALATGAGYVNYMTEDEGEQRIRATYGANYERLVAVKRMYDPTNFFDGNQNIVP